MRQTPILKNLYKIGEEASYSAMSRPELLMLSFETRKYILPLGWDFTNVGKWKNCLLTTHQINGHTLWNTFLYFHFSYAALSAPSFSSGSPAKPRPTHSANLSVSVFLEAPHAKNLS